MFNHRQHTSIKENTKGRSIGNEKRSVTMDSTGILTQLLMGTGYKCF